LIGSSSSSSDEPHAAIEPIRSAQPNTRRIAPDLSNFHRRSQVRLGTVPKTRTPPGRESLIAAIVLGLSLLHCCNKKETVATLDEPLEIEWIYRKQWTGSGRFGGVSESGTIEVARTPPVEFDAGCWEPKPQLGATKDEVAYRCDDGAPWRLRYLGQSGAYAFLHCDDVLGSADKPDFAKMPSFEAAAARLVECGADDDSGKMRPEPNYAALWTEIKARAGDARLADILLGSVDLPFRVKRDYDGKTSDDWEDGYALLPDTEKKRVDAELEKRLGRKNPPDSFLDRALWHVSPLAPHLKDVYRARADERRKKKATTRASRAVLTMVARLHLLGDPEAGAIACDMLEKPELDQVGNGLLEVIALANYRCEYVRAGVEKSFCQLGFDCGEADKTHLCTKEELFAELPEDVRGLATKREAFANSQAPSLAAAYVYGELPRNVLLAAARRRYQGPAEDLPSCWLDEPKLDAECRCFFEPRDKEQAVCDLDGGTHGHYKKGCHVVIDDDKKRVQTFPEPKPEAAVPKPKPSASAGDR
jgi:hypothetical protein